MKQTSTTLHVVFGLLLVAYGVMGYYLVWHIPYSYPYGGPDELMHLSMAEFIAKHLHWPRWDDPEVVRNAYGVSYSGGGSIVYWLHGLIFKLTQHHRLGSFVLLLGYLAVALWAYRKHVAAGFLVLAGLFPQTLFIFSYVNSDGGTIITALLFGISVGIFVTQSAMLRYMLLFFFFAGAAVTARQHLWATAFLTFVWVLVYRRRELSAYGKRWVAAGFALALLPASWWFVTSYIANDGDILGVFTNAKSIAKFGQAGLPVLSRPWEQISLADFAYSTGLSLYGNWGWMTLPLPMWAYGVAALAAMSIAVGVFRVVPKALAGFIVAIIAVNFGFMLLYAVFYDYQAQGRYLYPSVYIVLGIVTGILVLKRTPSVWIRNGAVALSILNAMFGAMLTLGSYSEHFIQKPHKTVSVSTLPHYDNAAVTIDQFALYDGKLAVRGWVYDKATMRPFDEVSLLLVHDRNETFEITLSRVSRPDVAAAFRADALKRSGFAVKMVDVTHLPKGKYRAFLLLMREDKQMRVPIKGEMRF